MDNSDSASTGAANGPGSDLRTAQIVASWHDDRGYLLATASRILGHEDGAEDVVAEAFARLAAQPEAVREARGWLLVVVRRIALDRLRSAHLRLSKPTDPTEPDLDLTAGSAVAHSVDPADRITLDDEIRRALAVVLDWLTPGERAAFLLHDVFGLPFADVALLVGRSDAACRQLAARARRSIRASGPRTTDGSPPPDPQLGTLAERFVAACTSGDVDGLAELLHRDVSGWAVRAGVTLGEVHGADRVSAQVVSFFGPRSSWSLVPFPLDEGIGVLVTRDGRPTGMIHLLTDGESVTELRGTLLG